MAKIVGDPRELFKPQGYTKVTLALRAVIALSDNEVIDIGNINDSAAKGGLYVAENGHIFDTFTEEDEQNAQYKIVPIGLKMKGTNFPLYASFVKYKNHWSGAFIGNIQSIFKLYSDKYEGENFDYEYLDLFNGFGAEQELYGFGKGSLGEPKPKELFDFSTVYNEDLLNIDKQIESVNNSINRLNAVVKKHNGTKSSRTKNHQQLQRTKKQLKELQKKRDQILKDIIEKNTVPSFEKEQIEIKQATEQNVSEDVDLLEDLADNVEEDNEDDGYTEEISEEYEEEDDEYKEENEEVDTVDVEEEDKTEPIKTINKKVELKTKKTNNTAKSTVEKVSDEIYDKLLFKENWHTVKNRTRISFYLKSLFTAIDFERKSSDKLSGTGYALSKDRHKCLINTGLIDIFGNYIYIIDLTPYMAQFYYKNVTLMTSKTQLLQMGFDIDVIKDLPEPHKFVKDDSEYVFRAEIEEFDLDDQVHLKHVIQERIDRFPEKYRKESCKNLCDRIKMNIEQAIKISKVDYRYVLPKYDPVTNKIQFVMPFYFDKKYGEKPELAIVIGKKDMLWSIYTVLETDMAFDDVRLLCNPNNSWLY